MEIFFKYADIVLSSLKHSYIWQHVDIKYLSINMRALLGSKENQEKQQEFVDYLLRIGDGKETNIEIKNNDEFEEDLIQVQDEMLCKSKNLDDFIDEIYSDLSNIVKNSSHAIERTILIPKNEDVDIINDKILSKVDEEEFVYYSTDSIINSPSDTYNVIHVEYLNSLTLPGIPLNIN